MSTTLTSPRQPKKYRLELPTVKRRLTPEFHGRSRRSGSSARRDRFDGTPPLRFA